MLHLRYESDEDDNNERAIFIEVTVRLAHRKKGIACFLAALDIVEPSIADKLEMAQATAPEPTKLIFKGCANGVSNIPVIKALREITQWQLKETKEYLERVHASGAVEFPVVAILAPYTLRSANDLLVKAGASTELRYS